MKALLFLMGIFLVSSSLGADQAHVNFDGIVADARQELLYFFNKHENKIFFNQPLRRSLARDWAMQGIC